MVECDVAAKHTERLQQLLFVWEASLVVEFGITSSPQSESKLPKDAITAHPIITSAQGVWWRRWAGVAVVVENILGRGWGNNASQRGLSVRGGSAMIKVKGGGGRCGGCSRHIVASCPWAPSCGIAPPPRHGRRPRWHHFAPEVYSSRQLYPTLEYHASRT